MKPKAKQLPLPLRIVGDFVRLEASSGIILFILAILALVIANSAWGHAYETFLDTQIHVYLRQWHFSFTALFVIDDALMAVFFLLVGLEIKREILLGELNSLSKVILPAVAAVGGMLVPAGIYIVMNRHDAFALRGWAIPTATDIAFALGLMALVGRRAPLPLKLFLMTLAIFDDIGAILIIAVFYLDSLKWAGVIGAMVCLLLLLLLNHYQYNRLGLYLFIGCVLWACLLQSGLHPTLAGVILALFIPITPTAAGPSLLTQLEERLHPWVAYLILPLFSFANAGVSFQGLHFSHLMGTVPLGILLGLFVGKQLGVFGTAWIAILFKWAPMPTGSSWLKLYATAMICGVGFTMSLFIGQLAFPGLETNYPVLMRFGVLFGSFLSGLLGFLLLYFSPTPLSRDDHEQ
ncbi:MAG: Na+/H+ antiporter NhaA [Gammaproteobacteria bacterium]